MANNSTSPSFCDGHLNQKFYERNHMAIGIFNMFIAVMNVSLNAGFAIVLCKRKFIRIPSNSLLLSLTIVDLMTGAIAQTSFAVNNFLFSKCILSEMLDDFVAVTGHLFGAMSYLNVIMVSLDRYIAILQPFFYEAKVTKSRLLFILTLTWLLPMPLLIFTVFQDSQSLYYLLLSFTVTGWLLGVYFYGKIVKVAYNIIKAERMVKNAVALANSRSHSFVNQNDDANGENVSRRPKIPDQKYAKHRESRRIVTTVIFIMSALVATFTPIAIISVYTIAKKSIAEDYTEQIVLHWAQSISLVNGVLNPLIYCFRMSDIRRELYKLIGISKATRKVIN